MFSYQQDESWVLEFLSGVGWETVAGRNPLHRVDFNAVAGWIDNYCQANPLQGISDAAEAFVKAHPH